MLTLVEDRKQKTACQKRLMELLSRAWRKQEVRQIAWRPGSREATVAHDGRYWFGSVRLSKGEKTPRHWNAFGTYSETGNLVITVEVNIPTDSNSNRVAGFFATDPQTGNAYLMHDGGIGGGRPGIGREAFLQWSRDRLVPVERSNGTLRYGLIVAPLRAAGIGSGMERFIVKVAEFKGLAAAGAIEPSTAASSPEAYSEYFPEFFGIKKGERARAFEYLSRHGEIVHALADWREAQFDQGDVPERIVKNVKIDLGVMSDGELTEVYEVKTNAERQTLYTAIGQLLVHGITSGTAVRRFLVLPVDSLVPGGMSRALETFGIALLRFQMNERVAIVG